MVGGYRVRPPKQDTTEIDERLRPTGGQDALARAQDLRDVGSTFRERTHDVVANEDSLSTVLEAGTIRRISSPATGTSHRGNAAPVTSRAEADRLVRELRDHLGGHPDALLASPATGFTWCAPTRQIDVLLDVTGEEMDQDTEGRVRDSLGLAYDDYLVELRWHSDGAYPCRTPSAVAHAAFNTLFLPAWRRDRWGMTMHLSNLVPACKEAVVSGLPFPAFKERMLGVPPAPRLAPPDERVRARIKAFRAWLATLPVPERQERQQDLDEFLGIWN